MSFGGSSPSPLGDARSRANRRTSLGGGCLLDFNDGPSSSSVGVGGEEVKKDRRAMLDEWRRNRGGGGGGEGSGGGATTAPSSAPSPMSHREDRHHRTVRDADGGHPGTTHPSWGDAPPPSSGSVFDFEESDGAGLSALERYRLRKGGGNAPGRGQQLFGGGGPPGTPTAGLKPPPHPSHSSSSCADEDAEQTTTMTIGCYSSSSNSLAALGTPKSSRGYSSALSQGGAQRRVRRRTSLSPSEPAAHQQHHQHHQQAGVALLQHSSQGGDHHQPPRKSRPPLPPSYPAHVAERPSHDTSGAADEPARGRVPPADRAAERESAVVAEERHQHRPTTEQEGQHHHQEQQHQPPPSSDLSPIESVDSAAMRSRLHAMQRRIESLEREKMELSMSKAPLEARMRQREDAWVRERERLCAEIENHQQSNVDADEKYREVEMKNEALAEENARLSREQKRAATGGGEGSSDGAKDSWSDRLKTNNEIKDLRLELKRKDEEIKSLRITKVSLESDVYASHTKIETLERNYDELERDYRELETSKSQNTEAEIQLQVLTTEHTAMTAQLNATCADLEEIKVRAKADLQAKEDNWRSREKRLLFEISVLKSRAGKSAESESGAPDEDPAILKAQIEERDRRIAELEEKLLSSDQVRRALHNRIQELRGNVRVYVRTRPFLPTDGAAVRNSSIDILPDGESLTILGKHVGENHAFKFDKVFAPSTGQDLVFEEVSEFVQSALDGYHVCLFSYGQTGSGKTHTMQGSGNGAMRGIIPRAVEQILSQASTMQSQRWTFTIKASFLEIYNEELRDLLVMVNTDGSTRPRDARTAPKLSIKRNADGRSFVDGINMVDIDVACRANGMAQLEGVISAAARARSVATTKMNAQSSRSHSVFMLQLRGSNEESGTTVQGALNLCDLAGSERLDRSGAASDAQRLKETQAINKSLSCLGDVFTSLANGSKHVPFRNLKLTYLLQDCLSGDGKALMFVNLSPTLESSMVTRVCAPFDSPSGSIRWNWGRLPNTSNTVGRGAPPSAGRDLGSIYQSLFVTYSVSKLY